MSARIANENVSRFVKQNSIIETNQPERGNERA
jgi:hypothetical protein